MKPEAFPTADREFANRLNERRDCLERLAGGVLALDDLDGTRNRCRIEEMQPNDPVGTGRRLGDFGDRERGGVGGEDCLPACHLVELGEDGLLELHALGHRLDHEIDAAEALIAGRGLDQGEPALDLGGIDLARLHPPCPDRAGLRHPRIDAPPVDVRQDHRHARIGDRVGDAGSHRARPDDGCSEDGHGEAAVYTERRTTVPRTAAGDRSGGWRGNVAWHRLMLYGDQSAMPDNLPDAIEPFKNISSKAYEHPADRAATAALNRSR